MNAEQLLHEAQYAFNNISFGDNRQNRRNASRARSLARKVIARFPETTEAYVARGILRRLGDEAYAEVSDHKHALPRTVSGQERHQRHAFGSQQNPTTASSENGASVESIDWGGLIGLLLRLPKATLAVAAFLLFVGFGLLGGLLFFPLIAFALAVGPLRHFFPSNRRRQIDTLIVRINQLIEAGRSA